MPLKHYVSHKEVNAAKIISIQNIGNALKIELENCKLMILLTEDDLKHKPVPEVGMYYLEYEDGYTSFSPAKTFEAGYKEKI